VSGLRAEALSDVGLVREINQDSYLVDLLHGLFIVSDGMGGKAAGETASRAVVTILPKMLEPHLTGLASASRRVVELTLREGIVQFSQLLRQQAADQPGMKGMGATLALVWLREEQAHLAHMGDSRIYRLRHDKLSQLTEDHSVIALLLKHGEITPAEVPDHPARGQLSRYIGMEGEVFPHVQTIKARRGERFLLCSDGLWGMCPEQQIAQLLLANPEPAAACRSLVEAANQAGGRDNITVLVFDL
jgi:protein phosphatase